MKEKPSQIFDLQLDGINSFRSWNTAQLAIDFKPSKQEDSHGRSVLEANITASQFPLFKGKSVIMFGYLITLKPVRTIKGDMMNFGCFTDQNGFFLDTIHFPPSLKAFPFRGIGIYKLIGRVVDEFGFLSLDVQQMHKMPRKIDPRAPKQ